MVRLRRRQRVCFPPPPPFPRGQFWALLTLLDGKNEDLDVAASAPSGTAKVEEEEEVEDLDLPTDVEEFGLATENRAACFTLLKQRELEKR